MAKGIYKIQCLSNGMCYIGATADLKRRIREHKYALKSGKHENKHLQFDFKIYGIENFSFEIIDYCKSLKTNCGCAGHRLTRPDSVLSDIELEYIKKYDSYYHGYNNSIKVGICENNTNYQFLVKRHDNNFYEDENGIFHLKHNAVCDYKTIYRKENPPN